MKKQRKLDKRRRREGKTNYYKRLRLLKSSLPRFVVRKTNKYIILQIIKSENAQDNVIYSLNTKKLLGFGWPLEKKGSLKSLAAAYLAGFLIGKKALSSGFNEKIILDSGLIPNTKGSRVYAAVKGLSESGLEIPFDKDIMPSNEMIKKHDFFDKIRSEIEK